ncbi:MAG TPA: dihydrolipoamide acetyltransferase family protein [Longimicrobium sp.]|nr:dihydrolipoamide acetyltransferase family protein [Longimicrobium sp.]
MGEFRMPSLGADMAAGTLMEWRVRPGDTVRRGDIVAQVETEKAAIEVEVWESGIVEEILVPEGARVPVGTVLARLRPAAEGAAAPDAAPAAPAPEAAPSAILPGPPPPPAEPPPTPPARTIPAISIPIFRPPEPAPSPAEPPGPPAPPASGRVRASPAARRLAAERGVDLALVRGTGPHGAVVKADVERAGGAPPLRRPRVSPVAARVAEEMGIDPATLAGTGAGGAVTRADVERAAAAMRSAAPPPSAEPGAEAGARDRSAAMRAAVAAAVARSKREIPHYYLWTHVDLRRALAWLEEENAKRAMEDRLLPAALLLKATALALRGFPELNGFWIDGALHPGAGVHLGVAVFLRGGGLGAPAILDADTRTLDALMRELTDLVRRARSGGLRGAEVTSATITVTSLGDRGVEGVLGVIYPPQVAIVGFGKIVERPWAEEGMVGVRPVVTLTLAADHRASDGHRGSLFLEKIADLLQKPEEL